MSTQPKALRLADVFEQAPAHVQEDGTILLYLGGTVVADKAADELRRLHAVNTELLEALQDLFGADMEHVLMGDGKDDQIEAIAKARAAIARATGEQA